MAAASSPVAGANLHLPGWEVVYGDEVRRQWQLLPSHLGLEQRWSAYGDEPSRVTSEWSRREMVSARWVFGDRLKRRR